MSWGAGKCGGRGNCGQMYSVREESSINKKKKEKRREKEKKKNELYCKYLKFSTSYVGYSKQQDSYHKEVN